MPEFMSDGVKIAYLDEGDGEPVVLIHGFASNIETNWVSTRWVDFLLKAGRRVIAIDNRGHGESEKLYDLESYGARLMADDVRNLLDHLGLKQADIIGYSMGARISAFLTIYRSDYVRRAVFAGLGINMVRGVGAPGPIAAALEANHIDDVKNDTARTFRAFAEATNSDLLALAACMRSSREKITEEQLATVKTPVLVVVGSDDVIGGSPQELAKLIPGAKAVTLEGRDHMKAVGDRNFKEAALAFLQQADL